MTDDEARDVLMRRSEELTQLKHLLRSIHAGLCSKYGRVMVSMYVNKSAKLRELVQRMEAP